MDDNLTLGRVLTVLTKLPPGYYIKFYIDPGEEDDDFEPIGEVNKYGLRRNGAGAMTAVLFEAAPEDGWESLGDYFGHPPDAGTHKQSAEPYEHDDRCIAAINTNQGDIRFWTLLVNMIENRIYPTLKEP